MTRIRTWPRSRWAVPLLICLSSTACGADTAGAAGDAASDGTPAAVGDPAATDGGAAAGGVATSCLEGSSDCDDTPGATGTGGVQSGGDGSVPVGEAVAAGIQGPFLMSGYLVVDAEGARLCEVLAESFPPQCGGASALLDPATAPAGAATSTEADVTWSEEPVLVEGELVDGVFVVRAA